ncbi:MAG: serine/threonine-protein kinase, partial [Polyangiaceae bacterium]
ELSHPNIVPVYELGVEQGVYYIAMELCEGLTLSEVLAETGPLGPAEGAYVGAEICRALDYAHRRVNIVHRDVTPRNVLIDDEGAVRIIDFGIAAPVTGDGETARAEIFGSPGHMPPEQLHGADLSPATDVFAVGVLLIEAWTGYPPFRRATAQESEHALFDVPAPIDRHRPELAPLRALIASSVALDARDRPSAAEHLARPLREFLKSEDSGDIARRLGARVRRARRRSCASSPWLPGETGPGQTDPQTRHLHSEPPPGRADANVVGSPVTRTFAAREDLEVWTRKLSSAPAPLLETPAATPDSRRLAQAVRDVAADDGAREPSGISSSKVSRPPSSNSGLALVALCSVAFVVAAFAFGPRINAPRGATLANRRPTALALVASGESSAPRGESPVAAPPPSATPTPSSLQNAKAAPQKGEEARRHSPAAEVSAEAEEFGSLKVTADPRAAVELSGPHFHQLGQTPIIGLKVPTGRYQVVFRNDTFGTPLTAQVVVVAGGTRSVHADFRQAEPAVSVR